jgi:hypothetical protein
MKTKYPFFAALMLSANVLYAQSNCGNRDFENGNFSGWIPQSGMNTGSSNLNWSGGQVSNGNDALVTDIGARHTILTVNQLDSNTIDPLTNLPDIYMTTLAPNGGLFSIRLGNSNVGAEAEGIKIPFNVTSSDTVFTYQYACVFEDPSHPLVEQPGFAVNIYDANNNIIPSLSDTVYSGDPQYPFITSANNFLYKYKRWSGVSINLSAYIGQTLTIEMNNFDCAFGGHFGYTYIDGSCFGSLIANVWPGDCDYDLNANAVDLLSLGIAFGATGTIRNGATINWQAEASADWNQWFQLGANYKHSDCNGDGVVDAMDIQAIINNYGFVHPFRLIPQAPEQTASLPKISLQANTDTAGLNQTVDVDIILGTSNLPIDSIYGIAYKISYNNQFLQNTEQMMFSSTWFAPTTNMITLEKNFHTQGFIDASQSRIDYENVSGFGSIAKFRFHTVTSSTNSGNIPLIISDVYAIMKNKQVVSLAVDHDTVYLDNSFTGLNEVNFSDLFSLYPNPSNGTVYIENSGVKINAIRITNSLGQTVKTILPSADTQQKVVIENLLPGYYTIMVDSENGVVNTSLIVTQ